MEGTTIVYFETPNNSYAEIAGIFRDEDLYIECLPALEKQAKKEGFIVTEACEVEKEELIRRIQSHG